MIAVGQTGVGKTFRSTKDLIAYAARGRKVLIFDVNLELDYAGFKTLAFDVEAEDELVATKAVRQFSKQKTAEVRRIAPFRKSGKPMELDDKAKACFMMMKHFYGGMLVLEDFNNYILTGRTKDFVSVICTNRHRRQDILVHLQSLRAVDPRLWQNLTYVRFHKQVDNIDIYRDRFPNYELMKIAQLVVNHQYDGGNIRYFCYVDVRGNKLIGVEQGVFEEACRQFLASNPNELRTLLLHEDGDGQKMYPTRQAATQHWINTRLYYIGK